MSRWFITRLTAVGRNAIRRHLDDLGADDRYLRFGHHSGESALDDYVTRIDFEESGIFGAIDQAGQLVGLAHLGRRGASRELGLSVLRSARHQGLGARLLRRALRHAAEDGAERVLLQCLAENRAIISLARRHGARFEQHAGTATGVIEPLPVP
jgi:RimJ/RimL family protein N-acetyltransferase